MAPPRPDHLVRHRWPRRSFLALALALPVTTHVFADEPSGAVDPAAFERFLGAYHAVDFPGQAAILDHAIEEGIAALGPLRRSVGRRRLHAVNRPVRVIRIVREGERLVTDFDGDRYVAPMSGAAQRGRDPDGEPIRVSYRIVGDALRARYVGPDGEKRIAFELGANGRLAVQQTLLADELPEPIRYRLVYERR